MKPKPKSPASPAAQPAPPPAAAQPAPPPAAPPLRAPALADQLAMVGVLWRRDLMKFLRRPSRLVGAFLQPVIFWLMIGGGLASTFTLKGAEGLTYEQYFYPGILMMMVLFASIFGTITVIEDRNEGFLQGVLVAPGSRVALVLGKALGVSSVGLLQAAAFLACAPLAGFSLLELDWLGLWASLALGAVALSAFGFALAWWLNSSQAYHAVMSVLLLPAWVLSGAMFPLSDKHAALAWVMRLNPMSYMVDGVRRAFYDPAALPAGSTVASGALLDFAVMLSSAAGAIALAAVVVRKSR
ncbi:MAG: ABC transporter [Deltaproteobacteria bacterium]|nr:ABC transporter [Deltaproteobacteria bacterium]